MNAKQWDFVELVLLLAMIFFIGLAAGLQNCPCPH
jgi:hypothetical protein